jgi:polysaccharide deacetylase 2 family uncharacterized protein YibQ
LLKTAKSLLEELEKVKDLKDKDGNNCLEKIGYPYKTALKYLNSMIDELKKK